MNIVCIVEARMTSSRLPGKVLLDVLGKPSILRQIERIECSRYVNKVVVATTINPQDDPLVEVLEKHGIQYYRGSEDDVLGRVAEAAQAFAADVVVEITGDCPLVDMHESDRVIVRYLEGGYDLVSNNLIRTYPLGMDTVVMDNQALQESSRCTDDPVHREHVCMYLYEHPFDYRFSNIEAPIFLYDPRLRMTLDTREDYEFICRVYQELYSRHDRFDLYDMMKLLQNHPELRQINQAIVHKKVR